MTQETSHATNARILAETHFEISEFLKLFSPLLERHLIGEAVNVPSVVWLCVRS